jgi:hypothetical protein
MPVRKRVLVYGGCLNLAGLTACLKLDKALEVLTLHPDDPQARHCLDEFDPETIIFDLTDPSTDVDLDLLKSRPHTLLIGVDPSSDDVLVLTGTRSRVVTMGELTALVAGQAFQPSAGEKVVGENDGGVFGSSS